MRRLKRVAAFLLLTACARMQAPPGGPGDITPPQLLGSPDSLVVVPNFDGWIEFRFDEVISEGGSPNFGNGTGDLERLVVLSPDTLVPEVRWKRDRIAVRPRKGWQSNMVYRVELLPGVRDLRSNVTKSSMVVTVVTGGSPPDRYISGRAVDWMSRSAIPNALLEVMTLPDSLVYRGAADSTGRFNFGPLRNTDVRVRIVLDRNGDHRQNGDEPYEASRLFADQIDVGELWAFVHDTLPAKVAGDLTRRDSVTIAIPVNLPLDPTQVIPADSITVYLAPDTAATIGPLGALPLAAWDTLNARRNPKPVVADTTPPPVPVARANPGPLAPPPDVPTANKPAIGLTLMVTTRGLVQYDSRYLVEVHGVRTLSGVVGTLKGDLRTGKAPPPAIKADSGKKVDSLTTRRRPE